MLLRHVTEHVKTQNWTAIAIDLFIVVFGVFIGIQVSNWNATRIEEQKTDAYIERIREDLEYNKKDFIQRKTYFKQVRSHALAASEALNNEAEELGAQFLIDIYQTSQYLPRQFGRDTYDEILSVGALNSESEIVIRKRLANFYRSTDASLVNIQAKVPFRELIRGIIPNRVQTAIRKACGEIVTTGKTGEPILSLPKNCKLDLTTAAILSAVMEVKNEDIKHSLTRRISQLDTMLTGIELILNRIDFLDHYLESLI